MAARNPDPPRRPRSRRRARPAPPIGIGIGRSDREAAYAPSPPGPWLPPFGLRGLPNSSSRIMHRPRPPDIVTMRRRARKSPAVALGQHWDARASTLRLHRWHDVQQPFLHAYRDLRDDMNRLAALGVDCGASSRAERQRACDRLIGEDDLDRIDAARPDLRGVGNIAAGDELAAA